MEKIKNQHGILEMKIVFSSGGLVGDLLDTAKSISVLLDTHVVYDCNGIEWNVTPDTDVEELYQLYHNKNTPKSIGESPIFFK